VSKGRKRKLSIYRFGTSEKAPEAPERWAPKVLECGFLNLCETIPIKELSSYLIVNFMAALEPLGILQGIPEGIAHDPSLASL
jgi:hypothetical protein